MQKKIIALAIAGLASTAAFAQSNVTIYGRADYGFLETGANSGALQNQKHTGSFGSGLELGSRLGFKGVEDLGNGLKAIFEIEYGISMDQSASGSAATAAGAVSSTSTGAGTNAAWTNRHSYVGLTGGFGTAVGGRLDGVRYGIFNNYDPFGGGTVGNFTQITRQVDRANNAIAYITPNFAGFSGLVAYGTHILGANAVGANAALTGLNPNVGEVAGQVGDFGLKTAMVKYEQGPVSVTLDVEQVVGHNLGLNISSPDRITVGTLGASYDLGVVKLSALVDMLNDKWDGVTLDKKRSFMFGAKAPIGKFVAKAMYGRSNDKTDSEKDVSKFGIGADYFLSKRTNFYVDYGQVINKSHSAIAVSAAANAYGPTGNFMGVQPSAIGAIGTTNLGGAKALDIGIAHNF